MQSVKDILVANLMALPVAVATFLSILAVLNFSAQSHPLLAAVLVIFVVLAVPLTLSRAINYGCLRLRYLLRDPSAEEGT